MHEHCQESRVVKLRIEGTTSNKQTFRENDRTESRNRFDEDKDVTPTNLDKNSQRPDLKSRNRDPEATPKLVSNKSSNESDDCNKIDTDEVDDLFCKNDDSQGHDIQEFINSGQSQKDENTTNADVDRNFKLTDREVTLYQ